MRRPCNPAGFHFSRAGPGSLGHLSSGSNNAWVGTLALPSERWTFRGWIFILYRGIGVQMHEKRSQVLLLSLTPAPIISRALVPTPWPQPLLCLLGLRTTPCHTGHVLYPDGVQVDEVHHLGWGLSTRVMACQPPPEPSHFAAALLPGDQSDALEIRKAFNRGSVYSLLGMWRKKNILRTDNSPSAHRLK